MDTDGASMNRVVLDGIVGVIQGVDPEIEFGFFRSNDTVLDFCIHGPIKKNRKVRLRWGEFISWSGSVIHRAGDGGAKGVALAVQNHPRAYGDRGGKGSILSQGQEAFVALDRNRSRGTGFLIGTR